MKKKWRNEFSAEFQYIKKGRENDHSFFCELCKRDINLSHKGKTAISNHCDSTFHKDNLKHKEMSGNIVTVGQKFTGFDHKVAAAEATIAFHTVESGQSFNSNSCINGLFASIFPDSEIAKAYSSARTKAEAIIVGVLSPLSMEMFLKDLPNKPFSISTDASNHREIKAFPVIVRFFSDKGIENKLLHFDSLPGETSALIFDYLKDVLSQNDLNLSNLVAFSADNAAVNFGGVHRPENSNNVFAKLKTLNSKIIPVGCAAHVLHNAAKHACEEALSIDPEVIIFKIYSYFNSSTVRWGAV